MIEPAPGLRLSDRLGLACMQYNSVGGAQSPDSVFSPLRHLIMVVYFLA